MTEEIRLRPMVIDDYDDARLWAGISGSGIRSIDDSRSGVERFLKLNPDTSVVALDVDRIVGSILCGHDGRQACFYHVCVDTDYRRRGIGKLMTQMSVEAVKADHINRVYLIAFKRNAGGNAFWNKQHWMAVQR